ncbi:MAG: RHS repeat-associated core domain-containing protein, partial [Bryobacteraceae bacterium]
NLGGTTNYVYDGEGRRVQKVNGGVTTNYVYDAEGQLAAEYAPQPAASDCGTPTCYFTEDHLGSTRLLTDQNGNAAKRFDYLPFGEEIFAGIGGRTTAQGYLSAPDPLNPKFSGKMRDNETGLDWFEVRYDSSAQGRFTSPDPLGGKLVDPQTLNKYSYVRNNPLRLIDPTGMYVCADDKRGTETHCTSDKDKSFEAARQAGLDSGNDAEIRGASAYGNPGDDNGVTVKFGDPGAGDGGKTNSDLETDLSKPNGLRAKETVIIRDTMVPDNPKDVGTDLINAVSHEGSHVHDAQDFVGSITATSADYAKNLTKYLTELKAYMLTNSLLSQSNETKPFNCGVGQTCQLGAGVKDVASEINRILAGPLYNVTQKNQGQRLFPAFTPPPNATTPH